MKIEKIIGIIFLAVGLLFTIWGSIEYVASVTNENKRIYTTATIVEIEEKETKDDYGKEYIAYAEFTTNGETITSKLNVYKANFYIGKEVEVYYFENSTKTIYLKNSEHLLVIFPLVGVTLVALGTFLTRKSKEST